MPGAVDWPDDDLKLPALSCSDLEKAAADAGEGLKIFLESDAPLNGIFTQLNKPGKGIVTIVVPAGEGREVEIKLPKQLQITAAHRNAIKSLPGVSAVEAV